MQANKLLCPQVKGCGGEIETEKILQMVQEADGAQGG